MRCPTCKSPHVQRDYDDVGLLVRMVGRHRLRCNNCGAVFSGFDPFGKLPRETKRAIRREQNRRRGPRYHGHIPTAISLLDEKKEEGKAVYSEPSRGHCETISKFGMGISLVGTKFPPSELSRLGRLLFIRLDLPERSVEAVVSIINHKKSGEERKRKWFLGVEIYQMSDEDREALASYLTWRAENESHIVWE